MSRNYLEAFVVAIIAIALGFFMVWPRYGELQDIGISIEEKNSEIKNRQDYYANLKDIAAELDQGANNLEKINTALPVNPDGPSLMNFAQAAAMQSGLILKSVDYNGADNVGIGDVSQAGSLADGKAKTAYQLSSYSVSLVLAGDYANFKDFLSRIERSSRLIGADSVEVGAPEKSETANGQSGSAKTEEPGGILDYAVKLTANYYK